MQNYTCQSGVWTSVGAVASLYDISCAVGTPMFDYSQTAELKTLATKTAPILSHFFVENPTAGGTGVDPRFNLEPYATTKVSSTLAKTNVRHSPRPSTLYPLYSFCLILTFCRLPGRYSRSRRPRAHQTSRGSN